jgi:hypothetical protein
MKVEMMRRKIIFLSLVSIILMSTFNLSIYADNQENSVLDKITVDQFDDYYDQLLEEAEDDTAKPQWLVRTGGVSWELIPSTSDVAPPENCHKLSMKLVATRVYLTKFGDKLYSLSGSVCHDDVTIRVFGAAILDKCGNFCMKVDGDNISFRLFGCGRLRIGSDVIFIRMKGRYELKEIHYGFNQRGYAKRLLTASVSNTR